MTKITDIAMKELSLIFGEHKGEKWNPVNPDARVLSVKGAPANGEKPKWFERAITAIKALGKKPEDVLKGWYTDGPVVGNVNDGVDGDGDGASDYNAICSLVFQMYYDLSSATYISDDDGRSAAVVAILDNFKDEYDRLCGGDDTGKAGKTHSAATMQHIEAIASAHEDLTKLATKADKVRSGMKEHIDALTSNQPKNDDASGQDDSKAALVVVVDASKAEPLIEVGEPGVDGLPRTHKVTAVSEAAAKDALATFVEKADKEPYGDVEYADPGLQEDGKKRYPIDTKEHAKAAWSYINQDKNASKYSSDDLAKVKAKIKAACEKFDVDISDKGAPVNSPSTVDVQKAVGEAIATAMATAKSEFDEQLQAAVAKARTDSDLAIATIKSESEAKIAEMQAKLDQANSVMKGMVEGARKPTSPGAVPTFNSDGTRSDPAAATAKEDQVKAAAKRTDLSPIGRVIAAQRILTSN